MIHTTLDFLIGFELADQHHTNFNLELESKYSHEVIMIIITDISRAPIQ